MLLIKHINRFLSTIFNIEEAVPDFDTENKGGIPISLQSIERQLGGVHIQTDNVSCSGSASSPSAKDWETISCSKKPILSSHANNSSRQGSTEEMNAKQWAEALRGFMHQHTPAYAIDHPFEHISRGSSGSTLVRLPSEQLSTATPEEEINNRNAEVEGEVAPDQEFSNSTSGTSLDLEEDNVAVDSHVSSPIQVNRIAATNTAHASSEMNFMLNRSSTLSLLSSRALPNPISTTSARTTNENFIWLTVTERRFRSADRHLFQLLDAQERRLRARHQVWGREATERNESTGANGAQNYTAHDIGICMSQSVLFGPEFYNSSSGPRLVLPGRREVSYVDDSEGFQGHARNVAILSEIDRLFQN